MKGHINPEKLRRIERKYNVRLGVCLDMGGLKANAIYTPRGFLFVLYQPDATEAVGGSRLFRRRGVMRDLRSRTVRDLLSGHRTFDAASRAIGRFLASCSNGGAA